MNPLSKSLLIFFLWLEILLLPVPLNADEQFLTVKANHFVVLYESSSDVAWAQQVASQADRYYDKIADTMGYARYQNFWSWDNRAKIIIYASKERFHQVTGQPEWAKAGAVRDQYLFRQRIIVSYKQQEDFLRNALPHEISHLMLQDFLGAGESVPVWFDEGMAELQEESRRDLSYPAMRSFLKNGRHIAFNDLFDMDVRMVTDPTLVQLFYIQSVVVLDFLIKHFGNANFQEFCYQMKNGLSFAAAFKKVYGSSFDSPEDFEKKWLRYMQNE